MFLFSEILRNKEDIALIKLIENNELKDYREDLALFSDQKSQPPVELVACTGPKSALC